MATLTALALATPIFGFALAPPTLAALPQSGSPSAQLAPWTTVEVAKGEVAKGDVASEEAPALSQDESVAQLRRRAELAQIHRTLGIATWAATTLAVLAGTIQYRNLYGGPFGADRDSNPCIKGNAFPNQDQCSGTPWFHAITGFGAGGLYFSTLGLAIGMPDPDHAAKGDSQFSRTLRTHKGLRWVHLLGMVSQMVLGVVIANPGLSGLDRANDYDKLKLLASIHLAAGYVTLGALSYAGYIMLF